MINVKPLMEKHITISLRIKRICLFLHDEEKYDFYSIKYVRS